MYGKGRSWWKLSRSALDLGGGKRTTRWGGATRVLVGRCARDENAADDEDDAVDNVRVRSWFTIGDI